MPWQSHVIALLTSYEAFSKNINIARKIELEYMVRLFSERQISTIINNISPKLHEDRYIVIMYIKSKSDDKLNVEEIAKIVLDVAKAYSCIVLDIDELFRKPVAQKFVDVLDIVKQFKNVDIEKNITEILIGIPGSNSILIE
jgi:tRNA threonylcarbamoyladenosine modification (KEOPS) complex Cgi121 subunit